ncbi:MAG: hypothetical protein IT428_33710 [Planctomycetaceae bacterium]|nr:hypothetical protein [Planctomycetaceae bacterium]
MNVLEINVTVPPLGEGLKDRLRWPSEDTPMEDTPMDDSVYPGGTRHAYRLIELASVRDVLKQALEERNRNEMSEINPSV